MHSVAGDAAAAAVAVVAVVAAAAASVQSAGKQIDIHIEKWHLKGQLNIAII